MKRRLEDGYVIECQSGWGISRGTTYLKVTTGLGTQCVRLARFFARRREARMVAERLFTEHGDVRVWRVRRTKGSVELRYEVWPVMSPIARLGELA